jgi:hypothetical protein
VGYALSSVAWPGATAANGDQLVALLFPGPVGQVAPVPDAVTGLVKGESALVHYPIRAEARTGSTPDASYSQLPAADVTAHADANRAEGVAQIKGADQRGGATYGTMRSDSVSTVDSNQAKAVATSTVNNVALAGGAVKIASVTSTAQATSDGATATTGGSTTVADMTVGGQRAYFDDTGVHAGSAGQPVNATADQILNQALAGFGMKTSVASPKSQTSGATASYTAGSLLFTWMPPNNPSLNVFTISLGGARVSVNATPSFESGATSVAPDAGGGSGEAAPASADNGAAASPDLGGSSALPETGPAIASSAPAAGGGQAQPAPTGGAFPAAFFGGIGSLWILLTLAGAAVAALGAKRLADDVLTGRTATGCPIND